MGVPDATGWLRECLTEERHLIDLFLQERHRLLLSRFGAVVEDGPPEALTLRGHNQIELAEKVSASLRDQEHCVFSKADAKGNVCELPSAGVVNDVGLADPSRWGRACRERDGTGRHEAVGPLNELDLEDPCAWAGTTVPNEGVYPSEGQSDRPYQSMSAVSVRSESKKNSQTVLRSSLREAAAAKERESRRWWELMILGSRFEVIFACMILLNTTIMALEAQYNGLELGYDLGIRDYTRPADQVWPHMHALLGLSELLFGVLFCIEASLKFAATRQMFFRSLWNWFDFFVIVFWLLGLLDHVHLEANPMLLRLVRLFRLLRLLRLAKTLQAFDVLHIMISSLRASAFAMIWSLTLLLLIMCAGTLVLNFVVAERIRSSSLREEDKLQLFLYFGSFSRGMLSMFELTLGNWVPITRFLHDHVHEYMGPLLLLYQCLVGFAVIRVITGVFLHETFKVASTDDELMIMQKNRQIAKNVEKMQQLFEEADESGDGYLSANEFVEVMNDPRVKSWLSAMDLDVRDAESMFALVDDGDRKVSAYELVAGFGRLKGGAKSLDMNTLLQQCSRIEELLMDIAGGTVSPAFVHERRQKFQSHLKRQMSKFDV